MDVISGLSACLMIYLPAKNYNLPGSFGADAEFHPRFADGRRNGKFIIGRIVPIGGITVLAAMIANPFMSQMPPVFLNPFISVVEFVIPVSPGRSMAVVMFFVIAFVVPLDFVLVLNRSVIRSTAVIVGMDPLFRRIFTMPVFPAVSPGSAREYKYQPCNQHTDFHNCLFHGLASFVRI
jgi:hypothetical protein